MEKLTIIHQSSPYHTASTLLVNAIYGLIPFFKRHRIVCADEIDALKYTRNNLLIVKTHDLNFNELNDRLKKANIETFFICSERPNINYLIPEEYRKWESVIIFDYNELNETPENSIENIVDTIIGKIKGIFPFELDKQGCITRISEMNARYNEIKDQPFEYIDPFYEIHGSHRNRVNKS